MRITEIHIDHFGSLRDLTVPVPDDGPFVLLGNNEAGKSTLLAFLRAMLFGIPRGRPKDERIYPMAEHRIGVLKLQTQSHGELRLERRRGPHGGPVTITDADGAERPAEILHQLVGGVDREIYRTIYGFSLDELQNIRTVTGESVANAFHAASLGTDRDALQRARNTLEKQLANLFKPSGRTQEAALALGELDTVEKQLREHEGELEKFNRMLRQKAERTKQRDTLHEQAETLRLSLAELNKAASAWDNWVDLRQVESQLAELPPVPDEFPDDGAARIQSLRETLDKLESEKRTAEAERTQLETEWRQLNAEKRLAPEAPRIHSLLRRIPAIQAAREEIPALQESIQRDERRLAELLPNLGADCTVDDLDRVDRSVDAQHKLRSFRELRNAAQEAVADARRQLDTLHTQQQDLQQRIRSTNTEIQERLAEILTAEKLAHAPETDTMLDTLARIPSTLRQLEAARTPSPSNSPFAGVDITMARRTERAGAALALTCFAGSALLALAQLHAWSASLFAGGILCTCAAAILRVIRRGQDTARHAKSEASAELIATVEALLGPGAAECWTAMDLEPRVRQLETLRDRLQTLQREEAPLHQQIDQTKSAVEAADADFEDKQRQWRRWRAEHGFPEEATPEMALDILHAVEQAVQVRDHRDEARTQLAKRQSVLDQCQAELTELQALIPENRRDEAAEMQIQTLADNLEAERENQRQAGEFQRRKRALNNHIQELDHKIQNARTARSQLLKQARVDSDEGFLRLDQVRRERQRLTQQKLSHERALRAIYGPENLEDARQTLADTEPDRLHARIDETTGALTEANDQLRDLDQTIGELNKEIQLLSTDTELSRLKAERAALRTRLRNISRQWLVHRSAEHLIAEARRRFEEERQPEVVRSASEFLQTFTQGRYTRIIAELEDAGALAILHQSGERVPTQALSRGTAEQLYLALRLGYITATRAGAEALPVVMDDILVNFDSARRAAATEAIAQFANRTQVLYFTCHPDTASQFGANHPAAAAVCELRNGAVQVRAATNGSHSSQN